MQTARERLSTENSWKQRAPGCPVGRELSRVACSGLNVQAFKGHRSRGPKVPGYVLGCGDGSSFRLALTVS